MKKMKKVLAVILSLAMVLGMSMTAFAADAAKITVNLPEGAEDAQLTYVRIVKPDNTSKDGWAFDNGYTEEMLGMSIKELLDAGKTETGGNKTKDNTNAKNGIINTTAKLGAALDKVDMSSLTPITGIEISVNEAGLYVIRAEKTGWTFTRMLAYVAYKENSQELVSNTQVAAKGAKDGVNKELNDPILGPDGKPIGDNGYSVAVNDIVKYKVTQNYPYYDADQKTKKFIITDTLTRGKFLDNVENTLKVEIHDNSGNIATLSKDTDYEIKRVSENQIKLDLGGNFYDSTYAGKQVVITYDVQVTEVTSIYPLENDVTSTTTKDVPAGGSDAEYSEEDNTSKFKIISPSVKADIQKLGENGAKLTGAEFTLYVKVDKDATHILKDGTIATLEANVAPAEGEVGLALVEAKNTEGENGIATFNGLDAQKEYYVVETKAPEGYSLNTEVYKLKMPEITETKTPNKKIDGVKYDMVTEYTVDSEKVTIDGRDEGDRTVTDTKLASLPSTGGIGTTIFTIGGCAIMIIAAALFFASRRKAVK